MAIRNVAVLATALCLAALVVVGVAQTAGRNSPTAPAHLSVAQSTKTSITLTWEQSTGPRTIGGYAVYLDDDPTRLDFKRRSRVATTVGLTYTFGGLRCGTTYGLAVAGFDRRGGRSDLSTLIAATTPCTATPSSSVTSPPAAAPAPAPSAPAPAAPVTAKSPSPATPAPPAGSGTPTVPQSLRVTLATADTLRLAWSPSSGVGVAGYTTYVDGAVVKSSSSRTARVSGLTCGRTYLVAVDAYDRGGNRSGKATLAASTAPCVDSAPPSVPTGFRQAFTTGAAVVLSWNASTDSSGVVSYGVYVGGLRVGQSAEPRYTFTGLTCGEKYAVGVDAVDSAGNRSAQGAVVVAAAACADSRPPTPPAALAAGARTGTTIAISWGASTDDVAVAAYGVYVGAARVVTTSSTSTVVSSLACGTSYSLGVDAVDAAGNRSEISRLNASTAACAPAPDAQPPTAPTGVAATSTAQTTLGVGWKPSTDNVGVAGYVVFRDGVEAGRPATTAYTLTGLACGRPYRVGVEAFDAAGNRSPRAESTLTTAACSDTSPPTVPANVQLAARTSSSISVTWGAATDNVAVAGYGVYRGGTRSGQTSELGHTLSGLACGTNYTIGVDAYDAAGNRSAVASVMIATLACPDVTPPTAPTGLVAANVTQTSAQLSWNASTDDVGVVAYGVYRDGAAVVQPTSPAASVSGLACGSSYALSVDAVDAAGNRSLRASVAVTTPACQPASTAKAFLSPSGNDSAQCTQALPCRSFQRGYEKAAPGDVVELAAGDYGPQYLRRDATKTSATDVVLRPAAGAVVTVKGLFLGQRDTPGSGPEHLTIENVEDSRSPQGAFDVVGANDVTLVNLDAANFYTDHSSNITIRGGDWGPCTVPSQTCSNSKIDVDSGQNILVENAVFHDYRIVPNSGEHFECMIIFGGKNITVRNSSFRDCEFYNIFVQHPAWAGYAGPDGTWPRDLVFERNVFTPVWENGVFGRRFSALAFSPRQRPFYNVAVRCNDFTSGSTTSVNDDGDGTQYVNFAITPLSDPSC